ncbi:unnamed protein product, partial [Prorocentrum cordatum]
GARRGPLDAETREKTSVLIFSMRWRSGGRSCQRPDLVREANLALGGGRDVHGDDDAVCQQLCDHIPPGKRAELVESVRRFAAGDDAALRFPPTLSNLETRGEKLVHREAEAHGLHHESSGAGAKRRIQVSRRAGDSKPPAAALVGQEAPPRGRPPARLPAGEAGARCPCRRGAQRAARLAASRRTRRASLSSITNPRSSSSCLRLRRRRSTGQQRPLLLVSRRRFQPATLRRDTRTASQSPDSSVLTCEHPL